MTGVEGDAVQLDPGVRVFLDLIGTGKAAAFDPEAIVLADFRRNAAISRRPLNVGEPHLDEIREFIIPTLWGGVRTRIYRRDTGRRTPAILYMHGGGWVIGSIDTHRRLMTEYSAVSGCAVIGLNYALAPEAPFPAAVYQCASAFAAVRGMADTLSIDPDRIAVAGDSAGANLAVAACLALAEAGAPLPSAAMLSYGVYDSDLDRPSYRRYDRPYVLLSRAKMAWFWDAYLPKGVSRRHPLASPIHADLSQLPPCHLTVAEIDILADENRAFAERAMLSGVSVELVEWPGTVHGFLEGAGVASISRAAIAVQCQWLAATSPRRV